MDANALANQTCIIAKYRGFLVHGSFPFAVFIIFILSYIQRAKKTRRPGDTSRNPFRDVFSLIYPIDLFDNHDRLAHCLAFGAASSMVLDLIFGDYESYFFSLTIPSWAKILAGTVVTIEIAVDCFPFFACITCKSRLVAYGMGFLYLAGWFIMLILISLGCNWEGAEQYPTVAPQIPVLICIFLLTVYFLAMFISVLIQRHRGITLTTKERLYKTHQAIYVRNLFIKPKEVVYTGWRARLFKNYKPHPGFIYPNRVLMPCFVSIIGLYQVSFWFLPLGVQLIGMVIGTITGLAQGKFRNDTEALGNVTAKLEEAHTGLLVSWWIAAGLSIFILLLYILRILENYRKQLLKMWSGTSQLVKDVKLKSTNSIVGSLKYIGFQVAVFLTGYMFVQGILFLFIGALTFGVLFCTWDFQKFFVGIFLELIIPSTVVGVTVMSSQDIFVKYFFIQDKLNDWDEDKPLALKNKVWFLIFSYVAVFLNMLFGMIFAILRVVIGLIISMLLLPRADRPLWIPGYGDKDLVYIMYVGNLFTENAHSNPILAMFCHLMVFDVLKPHRKRLKGMKGQLSREGLVNNQEPNYTDLESAGDEKGSPHLLKHFRWHLAYTLINNPSLIKLRKHTAILADPNVVASDGESKFVNTARGNGGNQMLPHIVEVMKRQNLNKNQADSDASPSVAEPSVNAVDPGLIVLEEPSKYTGPSTSHSPAAYQQPTTTPLLPLDDLLPDLQQSGPSYDTENPVIHRGGGSGLHTADSESNA